MKNILFFLLFILLGISPFSLTAAEKPLFTLDCLNDYYQVSLKPTSLIQQKPYSIWKLTFLTRSPYPLLPNWDEKVYGFDVELLCSQIPHAMICHEINACHIEVYYDQKGNKIDSKNHLGHFLLTVVHENYNNSNGRIAGSKSVRIDFEQIDQSKESISALFSLYPKAECKLGTLQK